VGESYPDKRANRSFNRTARKDNHTGRFAKWKTFEPLQENNKYFFILFGYLDVSADTLWVLTAPEHRQINTPPEEFPTPLF
jgi:hypothetical protein